MGAKGKSRGIQKMRGTPGLARALVFVAWVPLSFQWIFHLLRKQNKVK
jgi:hypothetical protein